MPYYLETVAGNSGNYVQLDNMSYGVSGDATRVSFSFWFEAQRTGNDFIPCGRQTDSNRIAFMKSDGSFELRINSSNIKNWSQAQMGGADTTQKHKYEFVHVETASTYQTTFILDDAPIETFDLTGPDLWSLFDRLFALGNSTRHGRVWNYGYTDDITAINSRLYDMNASGGTGIVVPETTGNGTDGTQQGAWPAGDVEWGTDTTGPGITPGAGEALVEVVDPVTDTTSIFNQLASGTIATGDYVHHTDSPNTVCLPTGQFTQVIDREFNARVWDATDETWGQWQTIEVNPAPEQPSDNWPYPVDNPKFPLTCSYGKRHPKTGARTRMYKRGGQ